MKRGGPSRLDLSVPALFLLAGCYEIPPRVPEGYVGGPAEPGWPPPAVYDPDRFHPANRLFQRLFVLGVRGSGGADPASGDVPFSTRRDLGAVDRAEVRGLLDALGREEPGSSFPADPAARGLLASDLLWLAARLEALRVAGAGPPPPGNMVERAEAPAGGSMQPSIRSLSGAARALAAVDAPAAAAPLPPPLREAGWTEVEAPPVPGLRPSLADLRWTRAFRGGGERPAIALVRLRIAAGPDGRPLLLPLGSEAWILTPGGEGRLAARAFRYRRSKLIHGEEPWEEVTADDEIAVIDPRDPLRDPPRGKVAALCSGCHCGPGAGPKAAVDPSRPGGSDQLAEVQSADARRALEALFSNAP